MAPRCVHAIRISMGERILWHLDFILITSISSWLISFVSDVYKVTALSRLNISTSLSKSISVYFSVLPEKTQCVRLLNFLQNTKLCQYNTSILDNVLYVLTCMYDQLVAEWANASGSHPGVTSSVLYPVIKSLCLKILLSI